MREKRLRLIGVPNSGAETRPVFALELCEITPTLAIARREPVQQ
jgi:hypothetical protein